MLSDIVAVLNPYCCNDLIQERMNHFWFTTARWVIRHSESLDDDQWQTILPWAQHRMMETLRETKPFSWKGRTVRSACQAASDFRRERDEHEARLFDCKPWVAQGWGWSQVVPGLGKCSFVELTTAGELMAESEAMKHCAKSYGPRCVRGDAAIFSMQVDGERRLTIEVSLRGRRLAQVFGESNRLPTEGELKAVNVWWVNVVQGGTDG
jgi:hypothetical protein